MNHVRLIAVGDVMLGDHPVCYGHGVRSTIRKHGLEYILGGVADLFGGADIVFCNLEGVLSNIGDDESRLEKSELRGDSSSAAALARFGFNLVSVANNHMLQHGTEAFVDTLANLANAGIAACGKHAADGSEVVQRKVRDVEFVIVGYSLRPERFCPNNTLYARPSEAQILAQLRALRGVRPHAHIIVSLHWGEEYLNYPSAHQIDFAHAIIDAGAVVLLGHHPHVLQGFERYGNGLIAYSLGNFVFDKWQKNPRQTAALECEFSSEGLVRFGIHPLSIARSFQVSRARGTDLREIETKIREYSEAIVTRSARIARDPAGYSALAKRAYLSFRMQSYLYFVAHLWRYKPEIVFGSFVRFVRRRLGAA